MPPKEGQTTTKAPPKKTVKPAEHPPYADMVKAAITSLKEKNGSSRQKILKYIGANYKVRDGFEVQVKLALKRGVEKGWLVHTKGVGASGSFKVKKAEPKPKPKKPAAKKPATKKPTAKKPTAKKPAAKKATTAAKGKKTTTAKKSAAKPAAKKATTAAKSPKKQAAKKATTKPATPKKQAAKKPAAKKQATKKPAAKKATKK